MVARGVTFDRALRRRQLGNQNREGRAVASRVDYERERDMLPSAESERLTVGEHPGSWLEGSVEGTVSRHTYRDYEDRAGLHTAPYCTTKIYHQAPDKLLEKASEFMGDLPFGVQKDPGSNE